MCLYQLSERNRCLPLLAGKSSDRRVSPIQGNNKYSSQYSQNTLPWHLFSWNGIGVLSVSLQLWNSQEIGFCEPGNWVIMVKAILFTCGSWIIPASTCEKNMLIHLSLVLSSCWVFWKSGCLPLLDGKSSDSTVSPNQSHNRNGILNPKNTLPWPFFSWHGTVCPRIVFTQLWNCRKTPFCDLWMETWWKKVVFSSSERWIVSALNLPEKYTGLFFPSLQQQLWSRF